MKDALLCRPVLGPVIACLRDSHYHRVILAEGPELLGRVILFDVIAQLNLC